MESGSPDGTCPDEPDWVKLYAALGDRPKQDEIRKKNPDVSHCKLLLMSASACDGCEKNPLRKKGKAQAKDSILIFKHRRLIDRMLVLYDYVDMNLIRGLSELSPLECMLLRVVHGYYRGKRSF